MSVFSSSPSNCSLKIYFGQFQKSISIVKQREHHLMAADLITTHFSFIHEAFRLKYLSFPELMGKLSSCQPVTGWSARFFPEHLFNRRYLINCLESVFFPSNRIPSLAGWWTRTRPTRGSDSVSQDSLRGWQGELQSITRLSSRQGRSSHSLCLAISGKPRIFTWIR